MSTFCPLGSRNESCGEKQQHYDDTYGEDVGFTFIAGRWRERETQPWRGDDENAHQTGDDGQAIELLGYFRFITT